LVALDQVGQLPWGAGNLTPPGRDARVSNPMRHIRCGKSGCRCSADPPQLHGPYYQWTRKVKGMTETRLLSSAQMARYRSWFEDAKQVRSLTSELEALSLDIAESAEDWG